MDEPPVGRPPEGQGASFEERLKAARERRGLDPVPKQEGGMSWAQRPLAMAFRVAGELIAALVVGVAIGWWLDRLLGTTPWLLVLFLVLGFAAGIVNVWRLVAPNEEDSPRSGGSGKLP